MAISSRRVGANVPFVMSAIASIPSPSFSGFGPFQIYGILIALGVVAAVSLSQRRWVAVGGHEDDISTLALWGVPAGVIGARLYHVATDFQKFSDGPWWKVFAIREGGLGIPGGMLLGVLVGLYVAKKRGMHIPSALDAVVPALPLAQAIGRWGNYFNQELYGRPTTQPWGLEIDAAHRTSIPAEFADVEAYPTFHPTFLYESLWNFGLVGAILFIDRKGWLPTGRLIAVYLLGYGVGRGWVEALRIDTVNTVFGLRLNIWMSIALILGSILVVMWPRAAGVDESTKNSTTETVSDTVDS